MRRMNTFTKVICSMLLFVALFAIWYFIASSNDYRALAGTYIFHGNGESCTLHLHPDQTFEEELRGSSETQIARGRWHRYGQAHVSFSHEFLKLSGEEFNAAGEAHGEFDKVLGIFPILVLAPLPDGPTFRKKWLL